MKPLCFYTLLLLFAISCKKEKTCITYTGAYPCTFTKNIDTVKAKIEGSWEWVQEKRANFVQQRTDYLTPCTEGYTLRLELKNDTARYYKNNRPDGEFKYAVVKLKVISGTNFPEDEDPVLVYYNLATGARTSFVPIIICNNYLLQQFQLVRSVEGNFLWHRQ
jgi:hypothetical protein